MGVCTRRVTGYAPGAEERGEEKREKRPTEAQPHTSDVTAPFCMQDHRMQVTADPSVLRPSVCARIRSMLRAQIHYACAEAVHAHASRSFSLSRT